MRKSRVADTELINVSLKAALAVFLLSTLTATIQGAVTVSVDWEKFLRRHDIVWEKLPRRFDHGVWHGNGLLGTVIYGEGGKRMRWDLGRSDVTTHRRDNSRLPIGRMVLETVGEINDGTARLDLWNAESSGVVETSEGRIGFRTFIHAQDLVIAVELDFSGGEKQASFSWVAEPALDRGGKIFPQDPPNPPSRTTVHGDVHVCIQPRYAGGAYATAWTAQRTKSGGQRYYINISDTYPELDAETQAVSAVRNALDKGIDLLRETHRTWWHAYYPRSFVSVPDGKIEGFYWIQMHKLACATRRDRPVMDLLGPWFRTTHWPRIWWNLNIQTAYLSVYTANHLSIGESLTRMIDRNRRNFYKNARDIWHVENCATVSHTTCYEGLRGDGKCAPDKYINPGDFTWALHNYYLQYRYAMAHEMVTDQKKHAFYPLLRDSVNLYLHLMKKGKDGTWHLPDLHSPEYGHDRDNNYNLALLRWACRTLIDLNKRYNLGDPRVPKWRDVLDNLVAYPVDKNGLRIGAGLAADKSHRHWSHMLMMHPLRTMNWEQEENRVLMSTSVDFWLQTGGGRGLKAWSRAAAVSLYAGMGDGDKCLENLHRHHDDGRYVMPNGMYIEGAPVIECALVAGRSLQDMLLQSWGDKIRVFPAVPGKWKEVSFHDLRAEGAFLVSAERRAGETRWIRVKSLAGEPCRIVHGMGKTPKVIMSTERKVKGVRTAALELPLSRGEEALLVAEGSSPPYRIGPVALDTESCNWWGVKTKSRKGSPAARRALKTPALSTGRPVKASAIWGREYNAARAFDDNLETRWGCAVNSRSGWLEVDLGRVQEIGGVIIVEDEFPRTQEFTVTGRTSAESPWLLLAEGGQIGGVKTIRFKPVKSRYVRLNIIEANEVPTLEEFRVLPGAKK